jgi:DNA invertase Pin-like site-specific DNA recombinase
MFQMMGVFAEFERAMIQERVRAGLAQAKAEGKRLGRPKIDETTKNAIRAALRRKNRPGILRIAKELGVGTSTVQRIAAEKVWHRWRNSDSRQRGHGRLPRSRQPQTARSRW